MPRRQPPGTVATNRRARHDYEILDTVEAGIQLRGSEVKTLREGHASLQDAYAQVERGEVILHMQIPAYSHTGYEGHEPTRPRKLLLHRKEIDQLARRAAEGGRYNGDGHNYIWGCLGSTVTGRLRGSEPEFAGLRTKPRTL